MWSDKFMARDEIQGYDIQLTGGMKILVYDTGEGGDIVTHTLKFLNRTNYNELILAQEEMVCFSIVKESKKYPISMETQGNNV